MTQVGQTLSQLWHFLRQRLRPQSRRYIRQRRWPECGGAVLVGLGLHGALQGVGAVVQRRERRDSHRMWRNRRQFIQYRFDALGDGGCIFWGVRDLAGGAMHQFALKFFTVGGLTIFRIDHGFLR